MTSLLYDLLVDLKRRTEYVLEQLGTLATGVSPAFQLHHATTTKQVERARTAIEDLLADPDLGTPLLEPNFFIVFKRLSELILNVEDSTLLILSRCSADDQLLSSMLQRMCLEVRYTDPPPLCAALSFQYFQALVGMDIIMTPQTQAYEFLAVPDLYHELAHFVVFRQRDPFVVTALGVIHGHFANALRKARQRGLPQATLDAIEDSHDLWAGDWQVEFLCDMIATFWCGPAYGWADLRLSATRGDPYEEGSTHPADDARRIGISCMLNLIGESSAAQQIDAKWDELKRLSSSIEPAGYGRRYPTLMLDKLAAEIHQLCVDSGFQSFSEQAKQYGQAATVSGIVNAAWNAFVTDTAKFLQSEKSALQQLHQLVGH